MAATKKTTNKKGTAANKKTPSKTAKSKAKATQKVSFYEGHRTSLTVAYLGIALFFLSIAFIPGLNVWANVRGAFFAFFGIGFYLFDLCLLVIGFRVALNALRRSLLTTTLSALLLSAVFSSFIHLAQYNVAEGSYLTQIKQAASDGYQIAFTGFTATGGTLGAVLGGGLLHTCGKAGGIVITLIMLLLSLILFLNWSFSSVGASVSDFIVKGKAKMDVSVETQKDRHRELKEQREIERQAREEERRRQLQQMEEERKEQERAANFDFNRSEIEVNNDFRVYKKRTPQPYVSKQRLFTFVEPDERKANVQRPQQKETEDVNTDILPPPEEPLDIPALDPLENERDETQSIVDAAVKEAKQNERKNKREVKNFQEEEPTRKQAYILPPVDCLEPPDFSKSGDIASEIKTTSTKLVETLKSFGVETSLTGVSRGPSVTRYELQPAPGVKISKITSLTDDIALNLAASGVRIEAPIPNKSAVGIEVPNQTRASVMLREIISSSDFQNAKSKLNVALGKDISGNVKCTDLAKMPHLLIAGTTGSGKSVCLNCMVCSILYNATPDEVKLLMIDPKQVEFSVYNGIPHLLVPVISDVRKAAASLAWAVGEMENRYKLFSSCGVRDIVGFNKLVPSHPEYEFMPQIVIFIDELNDLMMISPKEVEDSICRLAQKARAAGMHLVVATQRPSVDVITGIIKANIPSRLSLSVSSQVDSRTILDTIGAEKLLGNGDMLFNPVGISKPVRIQGAFISEGEIEKIVDFIKSQAEVNYDNEVMEEIERQAVAEKKKSTQAAAGDKIADADEAMIEEAINVVVECQAASTTLLQRKLRLGYGRAARIMDQLEKMGVVGPADGAKPRKVMMTQMQLAERRASADYSTADEDDTDDFDIFSDD